MGEKKYGAHHDVFFHVVQVEFPCPTAMHMKLDTDFCNFHQYGKEFLNNFQ